MTEMIFNGMFNNLTVPQCVALISCFVCDEKSNEMQTIGEELSGPLRQMQVSECLHIGLKLIVLKGRVSLNGLNVGKFELRYVSSYLHVFHQQSH
jgi:Superfamily II RNA helicase